jgi:DNA-binding GntR family transcriptional regulator
VAKAEQTDGDQRKAASFSADQLSARVASYVREGIVVGRFKAGEFIRTERLAKELGVSLTPVREALMLLGSEGSVHWERRRGYRVVPLTPGDVADLFKVQAFLAGELAFRAATQLSGEDLDELEDLQAQLEAAEIAGDFELVEALNYRIHRAINKASDSSRLATLLKVTVSYVPLRYYPSIEGWPEASMHDHGAIFTALRAREPDAARKAMEEHIQHIGSLLANHLERQLVAR